MLEGWKVNAESSNCLKRVNLTCLINSFLRDQYLGAGDRFEVMFLLGWATASSAWRGWWLILADGRPRFERFTR